MQPRSAGKATSKTILNRFLVATRRLFFRTKSVVFAEAEGWKKRSAESDAMLIVDAKARFQADTDSDAEKRTTQSDDADLS